VLSTKQLDELRRSRGQSRNRLGKAMELASVTQVQLAEATGLTQSYISRIKNGRYDDLSGDTMRALSKFFGCALDDLFPASREERVPA
jgi:transcriptional regulator with XRE-family HTH domain